MQLTYINTRELVPYAKNSRTHSAEQVAQIAASIEEFGFTNPVLVDSKSGIIAGHGRVMAAQKLKLATVPCIILDHLTETQKRAYVIADNKLALNAGWDHVMLSAELADLREIDFDLDLIGFDGEEIESILDPVEPEQPESSEQESEEK
jgi:ParB-like chromosome segregation protein Spo0J